MPIVLVIEDEELLHEIIHDALKEGGFDLTAVASGEEAVAMIESGVVKYSALVTDVDLKGSRVGSLRAISGKLTLHFPSST